MTPSRPPPATERPAPSASLVAQSARDPTSSICCAQQKGGSLPADDGADGCGVDCGAVRPIPPVTTSAPTPRAITNAVSARIALNRLIVGDRSATRPSARYVQSYRRWRYQAANIRQVHVQPARPLIIRDRQRTVGGCP